MLKNKTLASSLASFLMAATLLFTSCVPENVSPDADLPEGAILLKSENFRGADGTKLGVDAEGAQVHFIEGDEVWINGAVYPVRVTGNGRAYISRTDNESHFDNSIDGQAIRAVYPARIVSESYSFTLSSTNVKLEFPALYEYRKDPTGYQNVDAPLIAYAANSTDILQFKHLTAAITVAITNNTGAPMQLEKIIISNDADDHLLAGTPNNPIPFQGATITPYTEYYAVRATQDGNYVIMDFTGTQSLDTIVKGSTKYVQIPILPVTGQQLTIEILAKNTLTGVIANKFYYKRTQANASFSIAQNQLAYAPADMAIDGDESQYLKVDGTFTIGELNGKKLKVYFSRGNLIFKAGTGITPVTGTLDWDNYNDPEDDDNWAFAENQYDRFESSTAEVNTKVNTLGDNGWVSLFLYGATGKNLNVSPSHHPLATPRTESANHTFSTLTRGDETDWGARMGDGWFTLTKAQWQYLLETREKFSGVSGDRPLYCYNVQVEGVPGMTIYPDKYKNQTNVHGFSFQLPNSATASATLSKADGTWQKDENAGVVFLPSTGYLQYKYTRINNNNRKVEMQLTAKSSGYYWTSSGQNDESFPYYMGFSSGSHSYNRLAASYRTNHGMPNSPTTPSQTLPKSFAVRLVYPANFTYDELQNAQSK